MHLSQSAWAATAGATSAPAGDRASGAVRPGARPGQQGLAVPHVASIVRVFFANALERKVIRRDPCAAIRWERHLPAKRDQVTGWRQNATGFSLEQVVALTTDSRVPEDRRVLYAVRFLGGGLRPSSEANLRWRDLDRDRRPLCRLTVSTAFDTLNKAAKPTTKTGVDYLIPVHPVLEHVLDAWWTAGWAESRLQSWDRNERPPQPDESCGGEMVTPTGLEAMPGRVSTRTYADVDAAGRNSTGQPDASGRVATVLDGSAFELPSALASYVEACSRLAAEAAARGDLHRARELLDEAARTAALRTERSYMT